MKPYLKFIIPAVIVVLIVGIYIYKKPKTTAVNKPSARKVEQINQLAVKDRPYVTLIPRDDGKEVALWIDKVTNATQVEYEMEYQAENLLQGVFGNIDFSKEPTPVKKDLLFGSCSKGKCRYDENVSGGSLTLRFDGGKEAYTLKSDFNLQNMFDRQGTFTSKDIKATLDVGKSGLPSATYIIISGTMGLPAAVDGEVLAGPYSFLSSSSPALKSATITIQSKDDLTGAKLMFWNGKAYSELKATVTEGKISAPVTSLGTFLVVK